MTRPRLPLHFPLIVLFHSLLRPVQYLLLLSILGFNSRPVLAQTTATLRLPAGLPLKRIGHAALLQTSRQLLLSVAQPTGTPVRTAVQVQVVDSALRPVQQHTIQLRGRCQLLSTRPALAARLALFQFRQRNRLAADSTLSVLVDAAGTVVGYQAEKYRGGQKNRLTPLDLPTADVLVQATGSTRRRFRIQSIAPTLRPRWQQPFVAPKGAARLNAYTADSTHIWLLLTEHANSRRNTPVAVCLDAATGRQLSRTLLSTGPGLREAAACTIGPGHSLVLVGHAFAQRRPKNARMGELFVQRLRPDGGVLADQQVALAPLPPRHKVIWRQVQATPAGGLRIVGETYTKTSVGAMLAVYAVSYAATLSYGAQMETTLRPRDLLLLDLDATGQLGQRQTVALPKGGSFFQLHYMAARRMARKAAGRGTFRYRTTAPGTVTLLRTKRRLLAVRPSSSAAVPLRAQPNHCTQDIVGTAGRQMLVTEFDQQKKQFSLLRVRYW